MLKFSIVIPSFNQAKFLERTLLSIINQNYENKEIIVIDGGSTDESVEIIKKYEKHIFYWVSEKDNGQAHALNKGFAKATGDIFGWQNSDDIYLPDAFLKAAEIFEKYPEKKIVYGNWYEIDENDNIISPVFSAPKPRVPHFSYEGFDSNLQSMFWKKEVHEKFGKFDESLHQLMDTDFLFNVILNHGTNIFIKTDFFIGSFRRYEGQKTAIKKIDARAIEEQKIIDEKYGFPSKDSLIGLIFRLNYVAEKLFWMISQGGVRYAINKFVTSYRKRRGTL